MVTSDFKPEVEI